MPDPSTSPSAYDTFVYPLLPIRSAYFPALDPGLCRIEITVSPSEGSKYFAENVVLLIPGVLEF